MLVMKNVNHSIFLNEWESLQDILETPIYPPMGPNAEAGICFHIRGENVELGIYYETASGREIYQFYNEVILLGMDESVNFREELEIFFESKAQYQDEEDLTLYYITVDRPLDDIEAIGKRNWGVLMGYFMLTYSPNQQKNELLLDIFSRITDMNGKIKKILLKKDEIFQNIDTKEHQHKYDFYAETFSLLQESEKNEIICLTNILNALQVFNTLERAHSRV